jgi:hypothetical protein
MPHDRGVIYNGIAHDNGAGEGPISISIDGKEYAGTWVQATSERGYGYVSGGVGWGGWHRWGGMGGVVSIENPQGSEVKALLSAQDHSGLRCDLRMGYGRGDGMCRDDNGRTFDVQIRPAA